jgi:hypothetical protein
MAEKLHLSATGPAPYGLEIKNIRGRNSFAIDWSTDPNCYAIVFLRRGVAGSTMTKHVLHDEGVFLVSGTTSGKLANSSMVASLKGNQVQGGRLDFEYEYIIVCLERGKIVGCRFFVGKDEDDERDHVELCGGACESPFDFSYDPPLGSVETYGRLVEVLLNTFTPSQVTQNVETKEVNVWQGIVEGLQNNPYPDRALLEIRAFNKPKIIVRR